MPIVSMFYGVIVRMFFKDNKKHHLPHIHVEYQGEVVVLSLPECIILEGSIPQNKFKLVIAWVEIHKDDLLADWQLAVEGKNIYKIEGLK